ncbi:methyltransferase [Aquabacterium sp. A7-Y]|uniref:methyltransferase n=1 Tax=Aquabacterium sp. A7-Y TaxID=1349605 RepID=UPI00223E7ABA|nr:methyltransferase [Aquabacterium sp. A7-Y]MCW7536896.1 methyltransferase [Aquabacterium sp. A7-Y]
MYPIQLQRALYGFLESSLLFCAARTGVLEQLAGTEAVLSADLLGERCSLDVPRLRRVLNALAAMGVVVRVGEGYTLAGELRPHFDAASPQYAGGFIRHLSSQVYGKAPHLAELLAPAAAGAAAPAAVAPTEFFSFYEDAERTRVFLEAMWNLGIGPARELVDTPLLAGCTRLLDLGGGPGAFAIAAAERHARLTATVFDLAPVRAAFDARATSSPAAPRLGFVSGDFWRDPIPSADAVALGYVLSDWKDEDCLFLMKKVFVALPPGGHLLILEKLLDEGAAGPYTAVMLDISMLLETEGRHRTVSQYTEMLQQAGYELAAVQRSSGEKHLIAGRKPVL